MEDSLEEQPGARKFEENGFSEEKAQLHCDDSQEHNETDQQQQEALAHWDALPRGHQLPLW